MQRRVGSRSKLKTAHYGKAVPFSLNIHPEMATFLRSTMIPQGLQLDKKIVCHIIQSFEFKYK